MYMHDLISALKYDNIKSKIDGIVDYGLVGSPPLIYIGMYYIYNKAVLKSYVVDIMYYYGPHITALMRDNPDITQTVVSRMP